MPAQARVSGRVKALEGEDRRIVNDLLGQFVTRLREHDLDGALQLFSDDPVLFGSEAGETAHGVPGAGGLLPTSVARPQTYGWTWEQPTARKAGSGGRTKSTPWRYSFSERGRG